MINENERNKLGQFIHGHTPMNPQNKTTGRFYSYKQIRNIEAEVDKILEQHKECFDGRE